MSVKQIRAMAVLENCPAVKHVRFVRSRMANNQAHRTWRIAKPESARTKGYTHCRVELWDAKGVNLFDVVTSDLVALEAELRRAFTAMCAKSSTKKEIRCRKAAT